jgi:hypothetical protein
MSSPTDYGILLNGDIKLHRSWFKQMTKLIGITCQYKAPIVDINRLKCQNCKNIFTFTKTDIVDEKVKCIKCQYENDIKNQIKINTKEFDTYGDLKAQYPEKGIPVGCIFQEHPDQKTLKKMGWVAELQEGSSIIHVPYDLENLQVGCLFEVPSGIDTAGSRLFRVISLQNIMVYPASIACEIAPEYENIDEPVLHTNFANTTLPLLMDNEEDD